MQIELKNGYFQTNQPIEKDPIEKLFIDFIQKDDYYKGKFLQKHYNYGFDGYSYIGQKDSTNQYPHDLLHSFVFSEFHKTNKYPKEFKHYLEHSFKKTIKLVRHIEEKVIDMLQLVNNIPIRTFHSNYIKHMVSTNFYPKIENKNEIIRLSEHKDVSLFSIFPYGIKEGLVLQNNEGKWEEIPSTNKIIGFYGYLMECISNAEIMATNHKVINHKNEDRNSSVFFSIPKDSFLPILNYQSRDYYEKYLSLF
ncbi:MAG: hypothetical protein ISR00_03140 [Flavobacteriales bacterium]|nr:hypothetical protein [Flavobacteriales bacterium]